jgi:hypothetical protein
VVSSESPNSVVDTVVLRYFLLGGSVDLLVSLLGAPLGVPRIVFDPDEGDVPDAARSEITRSVSYQQRVAVDPARDTTERQDASRKAAQLAAVAEMHEADELVILDMTDAELRIASQLVSPSGCKAFGLKFPLGPGEASCIAIGTTRDLVVATDDADALRALRTIAPNHPYERIRKLLMRAVGTNTISEVEANQLHAQMRRLGFWDTTSPFPKVQKKRQA